MKELRQVTQSEERVVGVPDFYSLAAVKSEVLGKIMTCKSVCLLVCLSIC